MTSLRVITVLLCSLFAAHVQAAEPLRLVGDDFCPYNCDASNGKPGYIVEVLEEIFATQGIAVKYPAAVQVFTISIEVCNTAKRMSKSPTAANYWKFEGL